MTDLSPAAQAVLDACLDENCNLLPSELSIIAAALRAAASQLTSAKAMLQLQTLAAELEGANER